jgi:hypothetical protein
MLLLPSLLPYTKKRPGQHDFEPPYTIPDGRYTEFWDDVYKQLYALSFYQPLPGSIETYVSKEHGFFGKRPHPIDTNKPYFHIGIELITKEPNKVQPIAAGVLEYSGYGAINGYYVMLSHPQIVTEDGYVLHSSYCHLKRPQVTFNSYQKMLREISLGSYPIIEVPSDTVLGVTGTSGIVSDQQHTLYLQLDFRKYDEVSITLDPYRIFTNTEKKNTEI